MSGAPIRSEALALTLAALAAGSLLGGALGCAEPGTPYVCTCAFLTDFDDPGTVEVSICAGAPERAAAIARGCALGPAPAPAESCTCAAGRAPAPACSDGACLTR